MRRKKSKRSREGDDQSTEVRALQIEEDEGGLCLAGCQRCPCSHSGFCGSDGATVSAGRLGDADVQNMATMQHDFGGAWFMGYAISSGAGMHALFVGIFVTPNFRFGPVKTMVAKGLSRMQVYLSKVIASAAAGLMMLLAFLAVGCIVGTIMWGCNPSGIASFGNVLSLVLAQGLLIVADTAVFVFVAMSLCTTGGSLGVNICVVTLVDTLLPALSLLFKGRVNLSSFSIAGSMSRLATSTPAGSDVIRGGHRCCCLYHRCDSNWHCSLQETGYRAKTKRGYNKWALSYS